MVLLNDRMAVNAPGFQPKMLLCLMVLYYASCGHDITTRKIKLVAERHGRASADTGARADRR